VALTDDGSSVLEVPALQDLPMTEYLGVYALGFLIGWLIV
jgi:hypothetical protein